MILYHYRPIESALKEIEFGTFHFATRDELNDPIEGYVRVFWQGDKAAWEGLFRNYVCSVFEAIQLYLIQGNENMLHHKSLIIDIHSYDNVPLGEIIKDVGDSFLSYEEILKLASYYGDNELKVQEEELRLILHFIHNKALIHCIQKHRDIKVIPEEEAASLLSIFASSNEPSFPFDLMTDELPDPEHRAKMAKMAEDALEDILELRYVQLGFADDSFLYGIRRDGSGRVIKDITITEARQRRNWMSIAVDFPKVYVDQLKDMIYPESYIVCFSDKNNDSAMWGNYADHHQGVCLVYETDNNNTIGLQVDGMMRQYHVKMIKYGGETVERNFFTTLGRLNLPQIRTWLSGTKGISKCYQDFGDEEKWRQLYWSAFESKTYQKSPAWGYEHEYRIAIDNFYGSYENTKSRNIKYDPCALKGIIFGINTSEYDKKRFVEHMFAKKGNVGDFKFYQAEYDDKKQIISIREKKLWKI